MAKDVSSALRKGMVGKGVFGATIKAAVTIAGAIVGMCIFGLSLDDVTSGRLG